MGLKGITMNTAAEAEPHIYAEDDAAIYQAMFGEDGVLTLGQQFAATVLSNNKVRVADGILCVGGHIARTPYGEYDDVEIANGQSGVNRKDIIVAKIVTTGSGGIDTISLEVKQGTAASTATDPALTQDDIYQGGKIREYPLYRVVIEGLSITAVETMFTLIPTIPDLKEKFDELSNFTTATTRTNIASGETLPTIFGKIAKWFSDLKTGAFNTVANNLTTTSSGYVLDARKGKALQDQFDSRLPNYHIRGGSKSVSVSSGETSAVLLTSTQLKSMFGLSSFEPWRFAVLATNGNGSTCSLHIHGTTILNNSLYVLFGSAATAAATLTVNYTVFYYGDD